MVAGKLIKYGADARNAVLKGIIEVEKAVCVTLGPRGHTVLIDKGTRKPTITKDGVTVAKAVQLKDHWADIGVQLVQGAASRANHESGDGSTTTVLLTAELSKAGNALVTKGLDSNEVRAGFEKACEDMSSTLHEFKTVIQDDNDIKNIATISANNDSAIGETILTAFQGIGEDGVVTLKDSYNGKTEVKFSSGLKFDYGFHNGFYVNTKDDTTEFTDGGVIICNKDLTKPKEIENILNWMYDSKTPTIIITPSISSEINMTLSTNSSQGVIQVCPVKTPGLNQQARYQRLLDLAAYFGIEIIGTDELPFDKFDSATCVGRFGNAVVTPKDTVFNDVDVNEEKLNERVEYLKKELHAHDSDAEFALTEKEKESLKERIAKLTGGIATIFIGGESDVEIDERLDRYEDAVNAVRAAVSDGIVPGGGMALLRAATKCENNVYSDKTPDFMAGYKEFLKVCKKPSKMIMANTMPSESIELTLAQILGKEDFKYGYDAKNAVLVENMLERGIIDPIKVTLSALKYSSSTAALFLTTDSCITDEYSSVSLESNDPVMEDYR